MPDERPQWASISGRPIHGTATQISFPSVIPSAKSDKEVFWVQELVQRLPEFDHEKTIVKTNVDDSNGNHDVIVETDTPFEIGVQVTELTYELWRRRSSQRDRYLQKIISELQIINASSPMRVVAKLFFSTFNPNELELVPAREIAALIATEVASQSGQMVLNTHFGRILLSPAGGATIYVPTHGNIGVDVDIDELPRSFLMYKTAIDYLVEKKVHSKSPWLVIWSSTFWRDKHFLDIDVLNYMKQAFLGTAFSRVYFIESMDGEGFFQANIGIHAVKE